MNSWRKMSKSETDSEVEGCAVRLEAGLEAGLEAWLEAWLEPGLGLVSHGARRGLGLQ